MDLRPHERLDHIHNIYGEFDASEDFITPSEVTDEINSGVTFLDLWRDLTDAELEKLEQGMRVTAWQISNLRIWKFVL